MATPKETICEVCHERRATHFVCYSGTGKSRHLCDECFQSSAPPEVVRAAAAMRDAHCQYCGDQPCVGGPDIFALFTGVLKSKDICMPCSVEYHRFLQKRLASETPGLSHQEQSAVIQKLPDEADTHMKRWVSEGGSR